MYTIFIDDSGTAPEHKVANACGIVFPSIQIQRFESEWNTFLAKEGITDFHSSECLARNQHSEFAKWDDERVRRVFARVRQITFKYSIRGFCIGVHKQDYDDLLALDMKLAVGESHYTWAVSSVLGHAQHLPANRNLPMEYVFDTAGKSIKREIEAALEFADSFLYPGHFSGHYSFRSRKEVPALQCVDLFAWTCFQQFRRARFNHPVHPTAQESNEAYEKAKDAEWRVVESLNREGIEKWVRENQDNPRTKEIIEFKKKLKEEKGPKNRTT
jgi:hypothetical protein